MLPPEETLNSGMEACYYGGLCVDERMVFDRGHTLADHAQIQISCSCNFPSEPSVIALDVNVVRAKIILSIFTSALHCRACDLNGINLLP